MSRGINVPDDPNCIERGVIDSGVHEYYALEGERDDRLSQLVELARTPIASYAHLTKEGNRDVYGIYWTEPREIG